MHGSKSLHVAPRGGKWVVRETGATRATAVFVTRDEAIAKARNLARARRSQLYIHSQNGLIDERNDFAAPTKQ